MDCCAFSDCSLPPTCVCSCTEPETKLCDAHTSEHLDLVGSHSIKTNYIGLMPGKYALSKQCSTCYNKFALTNEKMLRILNENIKYLTEITLKFIEKNRQMEILYIEVVHFLKTNDKIIKKANYTAVEEFILNNLENPYEISTYFNKAEANLMEEIDLKKRSEDYNDELSRLRIKFQEKIKESDDLKENFERINEKNEKIENEISEVRQGYERTIQEMAEEIEKNNFLARKQISETNERIEEMINLDSKKEAVISLLNVRLNEALKLVEQKDIEIQRSNEERNKEITEVNKNLQDAQIMIDYKNKEIQRNNEERNQQLTEANNKLQEAQKMIEYKNKEIQTMNDQRNNELSQINIRLQDAQIMIDYKNKEIQRIGEDSIKEVQMIKDEKNKEINDLNEQYREVMKILEVKDNEIKRVIEAKNKEISEIKKLYQEDDGKYQSSLMCLPKNYTTRFCVINIFSGNYKMTEISICDKVSMKSGFCELPNENWFYYSTFEGGICYIVDMKNKIGVKQKSFKIKRYIGSCCYVNNCVYLFGGKMNGSPCSHSEKFDLQTNDWQEIPPIPSPCTYISAVSDKNNIIISAYQHLGIMEYDTSNGSYMSYLDLGYSPCHTILSIGYGNIYLFHNNSLWDITNYNQNQLTKIKSHTGVPNLRLISGPIRNGSNIFFILKNKELWRFDLRSCEIIPICLIKL